MVQSLLALAGIVLGVVVFSVGVGILRFMVKRRKIAKFVSGMDSGIYVEHGMVIDPATGLVTPQQKPSTQAYSHLL